MLEKLQAKRAALVAQREQCMANFNLTSGAIAIVDELLGELAAEASAKLGAEEAAKAAALAEEAARVSTLDADSPANSAADLLAA